MARTPPDILPLLALHSVIPLLALLPGTVPIPIRELPPLLLLLLLLADAAPLITSPLFADSSRGDLPAKAPAPAPAAAAAAPVIIAGKGETTGLTRGSRSLRSLRTFALLLLLLSPLLLPQFAAALAAPLIVLLLAPLALLRRLLLPRPGAKLSSMQPGGITSSSLLSAAMLPLPLPASLTQRRLLPLLLLHPKKPPLLLLLLPPLLLLLVGWWWCCVHPHLCC
jgi:hypothetical protein